MRLGRSALVGGSIPEELVKKGLPMPNLIANLLHDWIPHNALHTVDQCHTSYT